MTRFAAAAALTVSSALIFLSTVLFAIIAAVNAGLRAGIRGDFLAAAGTREIPGPAGPERAPRRSGAARPAALVIAPALV